MSLPEENGPLFLLSLDGGGIRGVSELVMLDCIMRRLQTKAHLEELPRPCDYFDLIAGTSTGGLIAILLGRLRMTTQEALETYDEVAETLFSRSNRKLSTSAQFKAATLEQVVKQIVAQRTDSDLLKVRDTPQQKGKAFVCAIDETELGAIHRLRTYATVGDSLDEWLRDCKIWEAARATTAAPLNFKAMTIERDSTKKSFVDAALGYNNPAEQLLDEACNVFHRERTLGALVSLGTGTRRMSLANPEDVSGLSYIASVGKTLKNEATDTERPHQRIKGRLKRCPDTYFRFNVPDAADEVKLAEWKKMDKLKAMTMEYLGNDAVDRRVDDLVDLLLKKKKPEGLTLKYIGLLFDRKDFLKSPQRAQHMGSSSNFFTGRDEVLRSMDSRFCPREPQDMQRREFLVCGMGGAGKTQIALRFVETRGKLLFKRHFWVDATDTYTAEEGYEEIASEAFPDKQPGSVKMKDIQTWMASLEEEWLLVLDNCNADDIRQFVPPGKTGNIVYTSRRHNLASSLRPEWIAEVNEMGADDAITLLLSTAGLPDNDQNRRAEAIPVVQELGYLPLAIDQAGAYIRRMKQPLGAYLVLLRNQREHLLRNPDFKGLLRDPKFTGTDPRNQAVYATFDITFNALRDIMQEHEGSRKGEDARNALNILWLICFYHNDSVMIEMFHRAAAWRRPSLKKVVHPLGQGKDRMDNLLVVNNKTWDPDPVMFGLMVLEDFSLAKFDDERENVSMHVLVYDWARASIGNMDMVRRAGFAKAILFDSIPYDSSLLSISFRRRIYPHMEACLRRGEMSGEDDCVRAEYMMKLATVYQQRGQFAEARDRFHTGITLFRLSYGADDDNTLRAMLRLVELATAEGKLGEAEFVLLQIKELREMRIGDVLLRQRERKVQQARPPLPELSPRYLKRLKEKAEAEAKADDELFGRLSALKAATLRQLSTVYAAQTMWDAAEGAMARAIELFEKFEPEAVAPAKLRLARMEARRDGNHHTDHREPHLPPEDARSLLEETIIEHGYGHRKTLEAIKALAEAELEAGNASVAQEVANVFLNLCSEEYGRDHRETLRALSMYSRVLDRNQQVILAEEFRRYELAASQRALGLYHPHTILSLLFLAVGISQSGRFDEGESLFIKGIEAHESIFGATHDSVRELRETLETLRSNKARATTGALKGIARDALRNNYIYTGRELVEDEEFEDLVDFWVRYNHIAQWWDEGLPEQKYFTERPPLVNAFFTAEAEQQRTNRHPEPPLEHE